MRLAVMQPYFFPYVGYFSLIAATDHFVVFDPVQYIRHGWINRNRILKPGYNEPQYVIVPIERHSRSEAIRNIKLTSDPGWKERILGQIQHYKKRAPNFNRVRELVRQCLALESESLVELNLKALVLVCEFLAIPFKFTMFEHIESQIEPVTDAGEWALATSIAMKAKTYINPMGGKSIFDPKKFHQRNIKLGFLETKLAAYPQKNRSFVPGLSIIDVLMFNCPSQARELIDQYSICYA